MIVRAKCVLKLTYHEFDRNMLSLQPANDFAMLIGIHDNGKFETLNDVEAKFFAFGNRDLFPN